MSKRKPSRKQVGKEVQPDPEARTEPEVSIATETALASPFDKYRAYKLHEGRALVLEDATEAQAAIALATFQPDLEKLRELEHLVDWAVPEVEASRRRNRLEPAELDQDQRNGLSKIVFGLLNAGRPLPAKNETRKEGKKRRRLPRMSEAHGGAIMSPLAMAASLLENVPKAGLTETQSLMMKHALIGLHQARDEIELRCSKEEWKEHRRRSEAKLVARFSAQLQADFGVSEGVAKEIVMKSLGISDRTYRRGRKK